MTQLSVFAEYLEYWVAIGMTIGMDIGIDINMDIVWLYGKIIQCEIAKILSMCLLHIPLFSDWIIQRAFPVFLTRVQFVKWLLNCEIYWNIGVLSVIGTAIWF